MPPVGANGQYGNGDEAGGVTPNAAIVLKHNDDNTMDIETTTPTGEKQVRGGIQAAATLTLRMFTAL